MTSTLWKLAEALRTKVAAANLAGLPTPELCAPDLETPLAELNTLRLEVAPDGLDATQLSSPHTILYRVPIQLVIRQRFSGSHIESGNVKPASLDVPADIVERLNEFLHKERRLDDPEAAWTDGGLTAALLTKHLHQFKQFTATIRITYEVHKSLA